MTATHIFGRRKYLLLLVALVLMMVTQPLLGHRSLVAAVLFDALFGLICLHVLFVVFDERWERRAALGLIAAVIAGNVALYAAAPQWQAVSGAVFHAATIVFLGFAVAAILRALFRERVIGADDVTGAVCGYLLGGMAWAHLYGLTYLIEPGAFTVKPEIAWRLEQWYLRRALFDFLSLMTLTSIGYNDITPIGPPAFSFTWLEVVFGQFYMAVVVAQLVGLKMTRPIHEGRPGGDDRAALAPRDR